MSTSDVTVMSLVTDTKRDDVCRSVISFVDHALSCQGAQHKRLPITRDYIDWSVNGSGTLTIVLDQVGASCLVMVATRNVAPVLCSNVAAALCRDYDAHTVLCDGTTPIDAEVFKTTGDPTVVSLPPRRHVVPRKVHGNGTSRSNGRHTEERMDDWIMSALRSQFKLIDLADVELLEVEQRRAKTVPMRLSAWALSLTTALIMAPLAIPLIVHNLVRGEDVRSGAMALGVAGLYAVLAQTGMAPNFPELL